MHDTESIKGHDEQTVAKDPVCDSSRKPKIVRVEPDEAKPGQTITIKGEHFGTRDCFRGVAFSGSRIHQDRLQVCERHDRRSDGS